MDPVTQTVLGGSVGALFRPKLGRKAIALGALCGAIPDVDVVAGLAGEWATLVHHRGATHSLFVLTAAAPAFGWLGYRWSGRQHFATWTHLAFWALVTHPLLDWCTSYGTQLLWPFTAHRFALDAVAVIDPLYTLPLLLAVLLGLLTRISAQSARRIAAVALVISTGYLALGYSQSLRALRLGGSQLAAREFRWQEIRATPTLFNVWLWRIVARDYNGDIAVGLVSTWSPAATAFEVLQRPENPLVEAALASERGRVFAWFAMDMVSATVEPYSDGAAVMLSDQRYALITRPTESPFRAQAVFDRSGQLTTVRRLRGRGEVDVARELRRMWDLIRGRTPAETNYGRKAARRSLQSANRQSEIASQKFPMRCSASAAGVLCLETFFRSHQEPTR